MHHHREARTAGEEVMEDPAAPYANTIAVAVQEIEQMPEGAKLRVHRLFVRCFQPMRGTLIFGDFDALHFDARTHVSKGSSQSPFTVLRRFIPLSFLSPTITIHLSLPRLHRSFISTHSSALSPIRRVLSLPRQTFCSFAANTLIPSPSPSVLSVPDSAAVPLTHQHTAAQIHRRKTQPTAASFFILSAPQREHPCERSAQQLGGPQIYIP